MPPRRQQWPLSDMIRASENPATRRPQWLVESRAIASLVAALIPQQRRPVGSLPSAALAYRQQLWHIFENAFSTSPALQQLRQQWRLTGNARRSPSPLPESQQSPLDNARASSTVTAPSQHHSSLVRSTDLSSTVMGPLQQHRNQVGSASSSSTSIMPAMLAAPQQRRGPRIKHCAPADPSARQRAAAASLQRRQHRSLDGSDSTEPASLAPPQQRRRPQARPWARRIAAARRAQLRQRLFGKRSG